MKDYCKQCTATMPERDEDEKKKIEQCATRVHARMHITLIACQVRMPYTTVEMKLTNNRPYYELASDDVTQRTYVFESPQETVGYDCVQYPMKFVLGNHDHDFID